MSPSIIDERLAEIDRRLRSIQSGLEPTEEPVDAGDQTPLRSVPTPAEPLEEPTGWPAETGEDRARPTVFVAGRVDGSADDAIPVAIAPVVDELRELRSGHERLLELHRELLGQYAELLGDRAGAFASATVTAGPFSAADALREFERALAAVPGVLGVSVREYLEGDRVSLEVTLASA